MKVTTLLALLIFSVVCNYCGKDFTSLGRHSWRCKSKIPNQQDRNHYCGENLENRNNDELPDVQVNDDSISNRGNVLSTCGKSCKGLRGLKSHQRSCCIIKSLNDALLYDIELVNDVEIEILENYTISGSPSLEPGVNLPKPLEDWNLANTFFIANISCTDIKERYLNTVVQDFSTIIYDYFKTNFGIVKTYNDTKRQLRNELERLKKENTDRNAIVYVSKLLHSKVQPTPNANIDNINYDEEVSKSFGRIANVLLTAPEEFYLPLTKRHVTHTLRKRSAVQTL